MGRTTWVLTAVLLAGCGGEYILTAPDAAVLAGQDVPVVMRLQRREFWRVAPPQKGAVITFRLGEEVLRSARTDKAGYAAVSIKGPSSAGRYEVAMYHQDVHGDSADGRAAVYALDPDRPVVAVDMDSLPQGESAGRWRWLGLGRRSARQPAEAAEAIVRLGRSGQVVYVTGKYAGTPARAHELLAAAGYPDGPVLHYGKPRRWWQWRRGGGINALDELRRRMPRLRWGVTADAAAAEAFSAADLKVLMVGKKPARIEDAEHFTSWAELKITSLGKPD